jgi:cytochrome c oxidase cbb3-type subunit 2
MPTYGWLTDRPVSGALVQKKMRLLNAMGDPYSDEDIDAAPSVVQGKNEMDALVAYLQSLGHSRSGR